MQEMRERERRRQLRRHMSSSNKTHLTRYFFYPPDPIESIPPNVREHVSDFGKVQVREMQIDPVESYLNPEKPSGRGRIVRKISLCRRHIDWIHLLHHCILWGSLALVCGKDGERYKRR